MCAANSQFSPFVKQCYITLAVDLTNVGFGTATGFPAILIPQLREPQSAVQPSKEEESWIISVYALGMIGGYFLTPPTMDRLGRKKAHYLVTILLITGWIITALIINVKALVIARILHGMSGGLLSTLSPVLIGECTSPRNRGAFLSTLAFSQSVGYLLAHLLGSLLTWQWTAFVCVFFPFASLLMSIYTPESPSWLLVKGRTDEFQKNFRWLRGDGEEEELTSMLRAKSDALKMEETKSLNLGYITDVIVKKEFFKPIIIMIHSNVLLQCAGGPILITYSSVIIIMVMGPTANFYFWTVFIDIWRLFANVVAVFVIRRLRRRTIIIFSTVLCILSHVGIVAYLYGSSEGWFGKSTWLPALLLCVQLFTNAVGIAPIRNVLAGELFPLKYRSIGGSISFASGSITLFGVLKTFPALVDSLQFHGTYMLYGCILIYNLLVLWVMLPETKGKTLQQIEDEFKGKKRNETDLAQLTVQLNTKESTL